MGHVIEDLPLQLEREVSFRILVIEDEDSLQEHYALHFKDLERKLQQRNAIEFKIVPARSVEDAKNVLASQIPDQIVLDLRIPSHRDGHSKLALGLGLLSIIQDAGWLERTVVFSAEFGDVSKAQTMEWEERGVKFVRKGNFIILNQYIQKAVERRVSPRQAAKGPLQDATRHASPMHVVPQVPHVEKGADLAGKRAALLEQRIRSLVPYAERNVVNSFGLCFSGCVRDVERGSHALENELQERLGLDLQRDYADPLMRPLLEIDDCLKTGRRDWAHLQTSLGLGSVAAPRIVNIRQIIANLQKEFAPYLTFKSEVADEKVISFDGEVEAILSEMILGTLADCSKSQASLEHEKRAAALQEIYYFADGPTAQADIELLLASQVDGDWLDFTLQDDLKPILSSDREAINEGSGIYCGARFSRSWGLSVMQHVAQHGGGRLTVEIHGEGNTIKYRIPRAHNG